MSGDGINAGSGLITATGTATYPLHLITGMLEDMVKPADNGPPRPRYLPDPGRFSRVSWSVARKSRLIESFLMNHPVPPIILHEYIPTVFKVIDGNRRLMAVAAFYADGFPLEGLRYLEEIEGRRYSELSPRFRSLLDRRRLSSVIILNESNLDGELLELTRRMARENLNPDEPPDC
jgi:hypothetical protein